MLGKRKVPPFIVGPENFTTYASPTTFEGHDRLTQTVPGPQKRSGGTAVSYSKLHGVDTTLVNYAEVQQNVRSELS